MRVEIYKKLNFHIRGKISTVTSAYDFQSKEYVSLNRLSIQSFKIIVKKR